MDIPLKEYAKLVAENFEGTKEELALHCLNYGAYYGKVIEDLEHKLECRDKEILRLRMLYHNFASMGEYYGDTYIGEMVREQLDKIREEINE